MGLCGSGTFVVTGEGDAGRDGGATKGFVDYWDRELVMGGVDANRTQFHILRGPNN